MQVDDLPADVEPQAHARAVAARMGLVEPVEDVPPVLGWNAQPVIPDRDLRHLPVLCRGDVDGPPIGAERDGSLIRVSRGSPGGCPPSSLTSPQRRRCSAVGNVLTPR